MHLQLSHYIAICGVIRANLQLATRLLPSCTINHAHVPANIHTSASCATLTPPLPMHTASIYVRRVQLLESLLDLFSLFVSNSPNKSKNIVIPAGVCDALCSVDSTSVYTDLIAHHTVRCGTQNLQAFEGGVACALRWCQAQLAEASATAAALSQAARQWQSDLRSFRVELLLGDLRQKMEEQWQQQQGLGLGRDMSGSSGRGLSRPVSLVRIGSNGPII